MRYYRVIIPLLYLPAGIGLIIQLIQAPSIAERLLSLALLMFCLELARMAWVDFENIQAVSCTSQDSRLSRFRQLVFSTFVLELLGFYGAQVSLPGGAVVIVFSQLWFNLIANIQLYPGQTPDIVDFGCRERQPVLIANVVGIALLSLWLIGELQVWLATGLLLLISLFLVIKYIVPSLQAAFHPSLQPSQESSQKPSQESSQKSNQKPNQSDVERL